MSKENNMINKAIYAAGLMVGKVGGPFKSGIKRATNDYRLTEAQWNSASQLRATRPSSGLNNLPASTRTKLTACPVISTTVISPDRGGVAVEVELDSPAVFEGRSHCGGKAANFVEVNVRWCGRRDECACGDGGGHDSFAGLMDEVHVSVPLVEESHEGSVESPDDFGRRVAERLSRIVGGDAQL